MDKNTIIYFSFVFIHWYFIPPQVKESGKIKKTLSEPSNSFRWVNAIAKRRERRQNHPKTQENRIASAMTGAMVGKMWLASKKWAE